jgi:hypothetical protein
MVGGRPAAEAGDMFTSLARAAVVAGFTAALAAGLAPGAWAATTDPTAAPTAAPDAGHIRQNDPSRSTPAPATSEHDRKHDPNRGTPTPKPPKPRSGAIINNGPLDPLEIAGSKSALDQLSLATKFLSTDTTGQVFVPPHLPAGGELITVTFGNPPNTSAPLSQRYNPVTGNTFERGYPLTGQKHTVLMSVVFSDTATGLQDKRAGVAWLG